MSRAKVIPAQAPQYRQFALISDFLDLANLSIQEETALATNWIKDGPEGLRLQNLTLETRTGRSTDSLPKNPTTDVRCAIGECGSWSSETIDPSRESIGNCKGFFHTYGSLSTSFFAEFALPVLYVTSGHPRSRFLHLCCQR